MLLEACVETVEAAVAAEAGGAGRVELCARLDAGGTTPDAALVERCVAAVRIPVFAMVRRRVDSFVLDREDVAALARDIATLQAAGADGLVLGALTAARQVDVASMTRLVAAARPLPVTFHKAIDETRRLPDALDALLRLGVDRVLTSGGAPTALAGAGTIAALVGQAGDALVVMAGGGIRAGTVAAVVRATGVREVHARLTGVPAPAALDDDPSLQAVTAEFVRHLRGGADA